MVRPLFISGIIPLEKIREKQKFHHYKEDEDLKKNNEP